MSAAGIMCSGVIQLPAPTGWREIPCPGPIADFGGRAFVRALDGLRLIATREPHDLQGETLHISASFPDRLPTWPELVAAKEAFLGDVWAYQVLPPRKHYLNHHKYTLHLFARADGGRVLGEESP